MVTIIDKNVVMLEINSIKNVKNLRTKCTKFMKHHISKILTLDNFKFYLTCKLIAVYVNWTNFPFLLIVQYTLGMKYAMTSMKLLVSDVLRNFSVHTNVKLSEIKLKMNDAFTRKVGGYPITIRPRDKRPSYLRNSQVV